MAERKFLIPDGDTRTPHRLGVCEAALRLRDELLKVEGIDYGRTPIGRCTRKTRGIRGCLIEIIPLESEKKFP